MKFKKLEEIQFISTVEGLESIEECLPRPAKQFIPKWFKDIPSFVEGVTTVKNCPSFPDYFSQGYIIPMWSDVRLKYDENTWFWHTPRSSMSWDTHGEKQLLDYVDVSFNGIDSQFVFKANCPWRVITPPGWSVLQLPLFYHFNKEWSVLPGVIDTDIHSEINQQVLYHGNGKEILIKRGDPFALYIPFKRSNKLKHKIRYQNEEDKKNIIKNDLKIGLGFRPNGQYRELQRKRDKGLS
jgi:hypothetical protein